MPLTQVACPTCGEVMQANALETAGSAVTPCQSCKENVFVTTDDSGRVMAITNAGAVAEEVFEEEEGGASAANWRLLLLLLLILAFLGWVTNQRYCARAVVPEVVPTATPLPILPPTPKATATPKPTPFQGRVFDELTGVNFKFNSAELTVESQAVMREVADSIKLAPRGTIYIVSGHTDNIGSPAYNQRLSTARAQSVRQFLIRQGVEPEMLRTRGYGASNPVESNEDEVGRAHNRRIEITLLHEPPG